MTVSFHSSDLITNKDQLTEVLDPLRGKHTSHVSMPDLKAPRGKSTLEIGLELTIPATY